MRLCDSKTLCLIYTCWVLNQMRQLLLSRLENVEMFKTSFFFFKKKKSTLKLEYFNNPIFEA
jgi:hypothetical protein